MIRACTLTYDDIGSVKVVHEEFGDDPSLFGPSKEVKAEIVRQGPPVSVSAMQMVTANEPV